MCHLGEEERQCRASNYFPPLRSQLAKTHAYLQPERERERKRGRERRECEVKGSMVRNRKRKRARKTKAVGELELHTEQCPLVTVQLP